MVPTCVRVPHCGAERSAPSSQAARPQHPPPPRRTCGGGWLAAGMVCSGTSKFTTYTWGRPKVVAAGARIIWRCGWSVFVGAMGECVGECRHAAGCAAQGSSAGARSLAPPQAWAIMRRSRCASGMVCTRNAFREKRRAASTARDQLQGAVQGADRQRGGWFGKRQLAHSSSSSRSSQTPAKPGAPAVLQRQVLPDGADGGAAERALVPLDGLQQVLHLAAAERRQLAAPRRLDLLQLQLG